MKFLPWVGRQTPHPDSFAIVLLLQPIDYEALVDPTFKADQSRQESRKGGASALCAGSLSEVPPLHLVQ